MNNGHAEQDSSLLPLSRPGPTRLAFLISGFGPNCQAIARAIGTGDLPNCEIAIVVCNVTGAVGVLEARAQGLQAVTIEGRGREQRDHEEAIHALLRKMRVDIVCLDGYLRVLTTEFLRRWGGRVLNMHPSLLPAFSGSHAAAKALEYGAQVTGCSALLLHESAESSVILLQHAVPILEADTEESLTSRILSEEQDVYVEALRRVLSGDFHAVGRRYLRRDTGQLDAAPGLLSPDQLLDSPTGTTKPV